MKPYVIEHSNTGLFEPAIVTETGMIISASATEHLSNKRYTSEGSAMDAAILALPDAERRCCDELVPGGLDPEYVRQRSDFTFTILGVLCFFVGLMVGGVIGLLVASVCVAVAWFFYRLKGDQIKKWLDGLHSSSEEGRSDV